MDLLGGYGDDSDEDENEPVAASSGGGSGAQRSVGDAELAADQPPLTEAKTGSPTVNASVGVPANAHGPSADSSDGTPGATRPRGLKGFKLKSGSNTPALHGSPALQQSAPSDESTPSSPARRSGLAGESKSSALQDVVLPDRPVGQVEPAVADRVEHYMRLRGQAEPVKVNRDLYDKKEFHNPGILEMLMTQYQIVETGSNYPSELFDPRGYPDILHYDKLRTLPAGRHRSAQEAQRPPVQHVTVGAGGLPSAGANATAAAAAAAAAQGVAGRLSGGLGPDGPVRKKSKWDSSTKVSSFASTLSGAPSISMASTGIAALDFERIKQLTRK